MSVFAGICCDDTGNDISELALTFDKLKIVKKPPFSSLVLNLKAASLFFDTELKT
jgi:hypothetical protein